MEFGGGAAKEGMRLELAVSSSKVPMPLSNKKTTTSPPETRLLVELSSNSSSHLQTVIRNEGWQDGISALRPTALHRTARGF